MRLYDYQQKIFYAAMSELKARNSIMLVVPTGGGKTVILSHIVKKMNLKTLIVAHTKELINQCKKTLDIVGAKADVLTIQSLGRNPNFVNDFDFLIIDECHRSCSASYIKLMEKFKSKKILGLTATPFRSDGKWLMEMYDKKINSLNLLQMIEEGLLSNFEGYRIKTECSLKGISTKNGDFTSSKLSCVINCSNRNKLIINSYKDIANGDKAVCFTSSIRHSEELCKEFQENGIQAISIKGKLAKTHRESILRDFKSGKIQVLINCNLLTEGFDEPSIQCILMARPTLSKSLYMQMIGRGSRLFPGKEVCKVIEFTDNEYDVCCLEDIIDSNRKFKINKGERLTAYSKRIKALQDSGEDLFVEKLEIIRKSYPSSPATPWQIKFLNSIGTENLKDITQEKADKIITDFCNGRIQSHNV